MSPGLGRDDIRALLDNLSAGLAARGPGRAFPGRGALTAVRRRLYTRRPVEINRPAGSVPAWTMRLISAGSGAVTVPSARPRPWTGRRAWASR
jgi:hypothetical protein